MINLELAKTRDINNTDIMQIQLLHAERTTIIKSMRGIEPLADGKLVYTVREAAYLHYCGDLMQILESELQRLWKFEQDLSYTKFWLLPHCTCPVLDNEDRMGYGAIIDGGCPVHGQ